MVLKCCKRCGQMHSSESSCPCPRCHLGHSGQDCYSVVRKSEGDRYTPVLGVPCSACSVWHTKDDCVRPSEGSSIVVVARPCQRCHVWHADFDYDVCESRRGIIARPCQRCHVWHSDSDDDVCDQHSAVSVNGQPCRLCNVWHGIESCAVVMHPADVVSMVQRIRPSLFVNRAALHHDQLGIRDAVSERHRLGFMSDQCEFCRARFWPGERINCCYAGSLILAEDVIPHELQRVILSSEVRSHIRQYNMAMAMASTGHQNESLLDGTFVMGGKSYHRVGTLVPRPGATHNFAQIYILDTSDATSRRQEIFGNRLSSTLLTKLHELMLLHNPYVAQYCQAAQSGVAELAWSSSDDIFGMQLGALISEPGLSRVIVVRRNSDDPAKSLTFISDSHSLYHTLAYPLLFPTGKSGWHWQMQRWDAAMDAKRVSLTDYMRYTLMHRDERTHVQQCERLALEFYCDAWAQVEARMASFHKQPSQQARYRVGRKCAIDDQLHVEGGNISDASVPMILPSSFVGSSKWYHMVIMLTLGVTLLLFAHSLSQLYMDAMALPMRFHKPDLFITVTCNPKWPELTAALPDGSHWRHHPDIVARVFCLKFKSIMNDILEGQIFGKVQAYVWRVEWQARGLPHVHLLIILDNPLLSARHIDAFVSAEVPDPDTQPELHQLVQDFMMHTPCDCDPKAGCREGGNPCKRHFPKDMSRTTVIMHDAYPKYRRRGLHHCSIKGRMVSDDWVVPYNPFLLLRYGCHLNIEIASHIKCFKYVYKYGASFCL